MSTRLVPAFMPYLNSSGAVLSGGKLYFYTTGTTSAKNTYSDSALTSANTNPIVLGADGKPAVDVWGSGEYKVVITDASDVTQKTFDPLVGVDATGYSGNFDTIANMTAATKSGLTNNGVYYIKGYTTVGDGGGGTFYWSSADTTTADGGVYFAADEGGTGRWIRIYSGMISVKEFGAVGDNSTDDTAAIQAAIDYGVANNTTVYFPPGSYKVTSTLTATMTSTTLNISLAGEDGAVYIYSTAAGVILDLNAADPATRGYYHTVSVKGLVFVGDGTNTTQCINVYGACYADCEIRNVKTIGATDYHIYLDECWAMEVINCYIGTDPLSRTTSGSDTLTGDLTFLGIQLQRVQS